jgi:hypothetical protein
MNGVPALKKLKENIEMCITTKGVLKGLDGRVLHCRSAFKGLNVLLQSAGAIIMKQVVTLTHKNIETKLGLSYGTDWEQMLMVHDEIQLSCKPQHTEQIQRVALDSFVEAGEFFGFGCIIEGDSRVGSNWAETH